MRYAASARCLRPLKAVAILVLASLGGAPAAVAKPVDTQIPVVLRLLAVSGEMASLDQVVTRRLVTDYVANDPVVSLVETGFQLEFTPTLLEGGRVAVTLDLAVAFLAGTVEKGTLQTPQGKRKVQTVEVESYGLSSSFEAADGETLSLDPVPAGPPIFVTPSIVVDPGGGAATMVQLEVRVLFGGHELQLDGLQLLKEPRVIGVPERQNSLHYLTRRTFVGQVAMGEAVPEQVEFGSELDATASLAGEPIALDLAVRCRTLDGDVPVFQVLTPHGNQRLQLPVLRTLAVETSVNVASKDTVVVGGVQAPGMEALVLVTPQRIENDGLENVLVGSRVVVVGGEPKPAKGEPVRSESLKDFDLTSSEGQAMALAHVMRREFVTGYENGEPVMSPLETQARLEFTPALLGGDDVDLEIVLDYGHLDPAVGRFQVKTSQGARPLDLPTLHSLHLDTAVAVEMGQTVVVGGILQQSLRDGRELQDEAFVFATPRLPPGGDAGEVALNVRVVHVSEGDGPANSSVERLLSGPVAVP